jgi:hypothetical protein
MRPTIYALKVIQYQKIVTKLFKTIVTCILRINTNTDKKIEKS